MDNATKATLSWQNRVRAEWIAEQIRRRMDHPAVVVAGLRETLGALAIYVVETEQRLGVLEGRSCEKQ